MNQTDSVCSIPIEYLSGEEVSAGIGIPDFPYGKTGYNRRNQSQPYLRPSESGIGSGDCDIRYCHQAYPPANGSPVHSGYDRNGSSIYQFEHPCHPEGAHVDLLKGGNTHHSIEAIFKAFAKALKEAIKITGEDLPSSKGLIET